MMCVYERECVQVRVRILKQVSNEEEGVCEMETVFTSPHSGETRVRMRLTTATADNKDTTQNTNSSTAFLFHVDLTNMASTQLKQHFIDNLNDRQGNYKHSPTHTYIHTCTSDRQVYTPCTSLQIHIHSFEICK